MSCMKQLIEVLDFLDNPQVDGESVASFLSSYGIEDCQIKTLEGQKGKTDILKIVIPGATGATVLGESPTLGIVGQLGGIGARPEVVGMVSDADGAIVALAAAAKLAISRSRGDTLKGDVIITTHVAPDAPILPHDPVPFMISPVPIMDVLKECVDPRMDGLLSVDATKGNRVIKTQGFAITPTVKNGWILRVSDDLINIYERVTGVTAMVVPITMQDITPYGNDVYHINSIMQPWVVTEAPVIGIATTASLPIPGSGSGANYIVGLESAARYCVEVARGFTDGTCKFYDPNEYERLISRYGDMAQHLRKM
ncbi:MAG: DUF1177 domain-containing protein [Candidatus Hermodarchaeota archaeon]